MKTFHALAAIAVHLATTTASAQPAEGDVPRVGRWAATIQAEDGSRRTGTVTIREYAGHWVSARGRGPSQLDACAGKTLPITVQESSAEKLAFTVWGAQVSPRCADLTIETRTADEGRTFEGTVKPGATIRLVGR